MHLVPPWSLSASPIVIGGSGILRTLSVQLSMSFLSLYCLRSEIHSNSQFHFFVRLCSAELFYYGKSFASSFNTYDNFATNIEKIFNQLRNDQTFSDIKLVCDDDSGGTVCISSEESALQWLDANPHREAETA